MPGIGRNISEVSKNKSSLDNLKNKIITDLSALSQKIIIIIDDIDRLNNEQIRLIFQLVNCIAGFPNMIYLLSFDKDIVARALSEEQNCKGEEYLEKIIQIPCEIPDIKAANVHMELINHLNVLLKNDAKKGNYNRKYWNNVFDNSIAPFVKTFRDVNRLINVFEFKYDLLHEEINWIDLLAVTTFQVCAPEIYKWLKININGITGICLTDADKQEQCNEEYLEKFSKCYDSPYTMLNALSAIFPKLLTGIAFYMSDKTTEEELRYDRRIACADRAQIYFRLSLEEIPVSTETIDESISSYSSAELDELFKELSGKEQLQDYLKELEARIPDLPSERVGIFLNKLVYMQAGFYEVIYVKDGISFTPEGQCKKCCFKILEKIGTERAYSEIEKLIQTINDKAFYIVVKIIVMIEEAYGRMNSTDNGYYRNKIITEEQLNELEDPTIARIKTIAHNTFVLNGYDPYDTYYFWRYKDEATLKKHISEKVTVAANIPAYLSGCAKIWSASRERGWNFEKSSIEEYISIDAAYEKLLEIKGTKAFSTLPLNLKRISIAFWMWYNSESKSEQYHDFSESNVDKLIPEWDTSVTVSHCQQ